MKGGPGEVRATLDGGATLLDTDKSNPDASGTVDIKQLCSVEAATISSDGRLYIKAGCDHVTQLWSVPIENESAIWNVWVFTYKDDPSDILYTPRFKFVTAGDRVLIDAITPKGSALITTDDEGKTWHPFFIGKFDIATFDFLDDKQGWIVYKNGQIVETTDGGQSWTQISTIPLDTVKQLRWLGFADTKTGFIVGRDGLILITNDGGHSWHHQNSNIRKTLYKVATANANRAWITGEDGVVLETSDSGAHWETIDLGITNDLHQNLTVRGGVAWIISRQFIFRSS